MEPDIFQAIKLIGKFITDISGITDKLGGKYGNRYKIYISLIIKLCLYTITFYSYKSSKMPLFT